MHRGRQEKLCQVTAGLSLGGKGGGCVRWVSTSLKTWSQLQI